MSMLGEFDENAQRYMRERMGLPPLAPRTDPVRLNAYPFTSRFEIPEDVMLDMEINTWLSDELRKHAVELKAYVLGLEGKPLESRSKEVMVSVTAHAHVSVTVPGTWWDAFKYHAITVSGNPFFKFSKIRWRTISDSDENTERRSAHLVTEAIQVDLYPDRRVMIPRETWGRPIQVLFETERRIETSW